MSCYFFVNHIYVTPFSKPRLIHLLQEFPCYRITAAFADNRIYAAIRTKSRIFSIKPHFDFFRREYLQTIKAAAHRIVFKLLLVFGATLVCFNVVFHVITFHCLMLHLFEILRQAYRIQFLANIKIFKQINLTIIFQDIKTTCTVAGKNNSIVSVFIVIKACLVYYS